MAIYKLGDIVETIRGNCSFQKKDLQRYGDYKALHYGKTYKVDYVNDNFPFWVNKTFLKSNQLVTFDDIILITTSETQKELGKAIYYNSKFLGLLGGEQILLKPKSDLVIPKWLYYWLKINQNKFSRFATGISVFRIKSSDLKFININLPSLGSQKRIIDIIEPLENIIYKFTKLSNLLISLGDKIVKTCHPDSLIALKEIANVVRGGTPPTKNKKYWNNGTIPWINSGKLTNSIVNKKADKKITEEALSKTRVAEKKDLVLRSIFPNINSISISLERQAVNNHIVIIKSNQNLFFNLRNKIKDLDLMKSGSIQQSITNAQIEKLKIYSINLSHLTDVLYSINALKYQIKRAILKSISINIY